jgi:uncharacterized iron-regulated membrane protein
MPWESTLFVDNRSRDANVRRLIFNIHLLIALIAGAFLALLGATGSIIAFEPELDGLLHHHLSHVSPSGRVLSLGEISNAVSRQFAGEPIVAFLLSSSPDLSSRVVLPRGIVYVNQHSGEILGVRARGQTFLGFARALHVRLATGDVGRMILRWSAVAMLFSLASGLYLWWPMKRAGIHGDWRGRRFWFDLHNAVGIWSLLPLFVLAGTGTVIGFEDRAKSLIDKVAGSAALRAPQTTTRQQPAPDATPITPDDAVAIVRAEMPDAVPYRVQMPQFGGVYQVALMYEAERITGAQNSVAVDPYSGRVIFSARSRDSSAAERILATNAAIHTGNVFGMPSRIIACLASVTLALQAVSGLLMWLRRNRIVSAINRDNKGVSGG